MTRSEAKAKAAVFKALGDQAVASGLFDAALAYQYVAMRILDELLSQEVTHDSFRG